MPVNYETSKLYKIWSPSHPNEIYIGSTTQSLSRRMVEHRSKFKRYQNGKTNYTTSNKILSYGDARIELIEKFPCKCKEELIAREGYYIRTLDCVNKIIPDRNWKEYYQDNKDKIKQYREDNKDQIAKQRKQYYEANREKVYQKNKQYREVNRETVLNYQRKYYEANREKLNQKKKQYREAKGKTACGCGGSYTVPNKAKHMRSKKHMKYLEEKKLE